MCHSHFMKYSEIRNIHMITFLILNTLLVHILSNFIVTNISYYDFHN